MSLRLVSYLGALDYVVGVEELEQGEHGTDKDYSHVYGEKFDDLPTIGQGGGIRYTAYPEELVALAPDMIITTYDDDSLEQLANETGIPVIGINYDSTIFPVYERWHGFFIRRSRCDDPRYNKKRLRN